jgi:hypothetical protein
VRRNWRGDIKGPFNVNDREKAGMTRDFYEDLKGGMAWDGRENAVPAEEKAKVQVGYE